MGKLAQKLSGISTQLIKNNFTQKSFEIKL